MAVMYRCPQCRQKFKWDILEGEPSSCHAESPCGYAYRDASEDDGVIVMPSFLSAKTKNTDATARQYMDASEHRAYQAAEMAGVPVSEMSGLKVTNLDDNKGSQFNVPDVKNEVTQQMDAMPQGPFGFNQNSGVGFSGAVSTGAFANAGARMQQAVRGNHASVVARQPGRNEQGQTVAPSTDVMSDRPANELTNAGYRRRV